MTQTTEQPTHTSEPEQPDPAPVFGLRHLQALLLFIGLLVLTILQHNVGVTVVAMTTPHANNPEMPYYNWTEAQKSYMLSSFYWGSALTQFLGGYLCKRLGSKTVLFWGCLGSALLSAATPHLIYLSGWRAYCIIRWMQGLCQGVAMPCIHQHLANWSLVAERTRLGAFVYTGFDCGNVLAMYATGKLASSPLGWPGTSYVSAIMAFSWCLLWLLLGSNRASEARCCISQAERQQIMQQLQRSERQEQQHLHIPWRGIFTSAPFYALLAARCADTWGLTTMQTELPAYLRGVLHFEMASNAFYSALPFLLMWGMCYVYLIAADVALQRQWLSLTALRKTYNTIALWLPASLMLILGFVDDEQPTLALVLVTLSVGVSSAATIGSELNTIDLSPRHASILMGIQSSFTSVVALLTPLVVGVLVNDQTERSEWQLVFSLAALLLFAGNVVYLVWGSAETQPWDSEDEQLPEKQKRPPTQRWSAADMETEALAEEAKATKPLHQLI